MKILSIDLETFSEVDIKKCGLYKYAEHAEILLFAYAFDDEPVQVVDFTAGEELPEEVKSALTSSDVLKTAYNAAFEMNVIRKAMNVPIDPNQWLCTMVQAYTLGLPGGLDAVGKAIGLPEDKQKLSVGKRLIQYFCKPCKPTKANGGRTRNTPFDDIEKWELFKEYNAQDVEAERAIRKRIEFAFPIETERKLWCLDCDINRRGVLVDTELVESAITIDKLIKEEALQDAKDLTGMENPNSTVQIMDWFEQQEGYRPDTVDKKFRAEYLGTGGNEKVKQFFRLKNLLAKTSVKKYEAAKNMHCADNRVRGMLQFYGAQRTGRWCLTGDHEVLTKDGWVRMDKWSGGEIACWNNSNEIISFAKANSLVFDYEGEMIKVDTQRCAQISTPEHKMPYLDKDGFWSATEIQNLLHKRPQIPFHGRRVIDAHNDSTELRLLIMTQADGHYTKDALRFHFSKQRKIERCKHLLRRARVPYSVQYHTDKTVVISIRRRDLPMSLRLFQNKTFGSWLLNEPADVVFDELEYWDGYRASVNTIQYTSINKQNADLIQALAVLSDRSATMVLKYENHKVWSTTYVVTIWTTPGKASVIRQENFSKINHQGKVYCAETKTGYFLVRRNGKVWVTGNSGRGVQLHNLPQNHLPDLDTAREIVRSCDYDNLKLFYDNPSDVLSQLIRTAFIAKPEHRFIVADFSAIEARVIAWLADERWRQEAFANGKDIYCESASQMFGVPVVKHGVNGELRAKGKVAELACGFQGGVNALKAFGADKMGLSEHEMQDIITKWRERSPRICRMWRDIEKGVKNAIRHKGKVFSYNHGISFQCEKGLLFITLPSRRRIAYIQPHIEIEDMNGYEKESITYMGMIQGKPGASGWGRNYTFGGRLVENIVQSTARDCLGVAMLRLTEAGYKIVMHVHDEVILEMPYGTGSLAEAEEIMGTAIPWAPGLLLNADGYETEYYKKD